ncbi:Myosin tail domain containing protein, partial [Euroglyphus maynei]
FHFFFVEQNSNELLKQVESLRLDLNESANKIKQEQAVLKGKTDREVADLMITIEDQDRQLNDLQKQLRKQAKQVSDISLELQASQRQYQDVNEQLGQSQKRCLNLHHELEEMKNNLEKVGRHYSKNSN